MISKYLDNFQLYKIKWRVITLLLMSMLHACTGIQTAQDYLLNEKEGVVFFSITQSGILDSSFNLTFINDATQKKFIINLGSDELNGVGSVIKNSSFRTFDHPIGKLVVLRLPIGIYSLSRWQTTEVKKLGINSLKKSLIKKFRVKAAHSLYLGNIHNLNSQTHSSVYIRDYRIRDLELFYKRYPRVDKTKLLVTSKAFMNPLLNRDRVFEAFNSCTLTGYQLISKKRLPPQSAKFRTLRIGKEEKKISRVDGYRLKFRTGTSGPVTLNVKVEMSAAKDYISDKENIKAWFDHIKATTKTFKVSAEDKGYFFEYNLKTFVLGKNRMAYMVMMFDDSSQMITTLSFINASEFERSYKTYDEFLPKGQQTVELFQQCIVSNLNTLL